MDGGKAFKAKTFRELMRFGRTKVIVFVILFLLVTLIPCVRDTALTPYEIKVQPVVVYLAFIEDFTSNFYDNMALSALIYTVAFTAAYAFLYFISCVIVEFLIEQRGAAGKK